MAVIPNRVNRVNQTVRGGASEKRLGIQFGLWVRGLPQEAGNSCRRTVFLRTPGAVEEKPDSFG